MQNSRWHNSKSTIERLISSLTGEHETIEDWSGAPSLVMGSRIGSAMKALAVGLDDCEISFASVLQRDAVAVFSAGAAFPFFNRSPFPYEPVNWRRKSSSGLELAAFSWMLMPAFSLRIRLSRVSRTLPASRASPGLPPLLMKRRPG